MEDSVNLGATRTLTACSALLPLMAAQIVDCHTCQTSVTTEQSKRHAQGGRKKERGNGNHFIYCSSVLFLVISSHRLLRGDNFTDDCCPSASFSPTINVVTGKGNEKKKKRVETYGKTRAWRGVCRGSTRVSIGQQHLAVWHATAPSHSVTN